MTRTSSYEDLVRWARCLSEIMKQAGLMCKDSARAGYVEVSSRLQVSLLHILQALPGDLPHGVESLTLFSDLFRLRRSLRCSRSHVSLFTFLSSDPVTAAYESSTIGISSSIAISA